MAQRRQEILSAAADLFAQRGYHAVGVDEIGAALGISGPALYRHFSSKDAVLTEMLLDISARLLDQGLAGVAAAGDPRTALDALIKGHTGFALEQPALIVVQDRDLEHVPEPERRRIRQLQRRYVEVWVEAVRAVYPARPVAEARAGVHAVLGLINSTPYSARGLGRTTMAALLSRMARAALD